MCCAMFFGDGSRARPKAPGKPEQEHPVARQILATVKDAPGSSVSEIGRRTGTPRGTVHYHVDLLAKAGLLRTISHGRERRLFPRELDRDLATSIALLRRGRVLELASAVVADPGLAQKDIARKTTMPRKTLRTYADLLTKERLMVEIDDARFRRYYPTPRMQRLVALLEEDAGTESPADGLAAAED